MHITVLRKVAVDFLVTNPSGYYLDVTGGAGGHAEEILKKLDLNGRLIVCDQDPKAVDLLSTKFSDSRVEVRRARFSEVFEKKENFDGILADLGISSNQLDDAQRGLSFLRDGPLDIRLNPNETETAAHVIMERSEEELANIFFHFGEERYSRKIAKAIVRVRAHQEFKTTFDLKEIVEKELGPLYRRQKIHPATRIFQALRIFVNEEMEELKKLLSGIKNHLSKGGRAVVISFHSLEDREVKKAFNEVVSSEGITQGFKRITKKPVVPTDLEIKENPRARSAKLRVLERRIT